MANNNEDTKRCFRHRSCSRIVVILENVRRLFIKKINNCFWETSKPQLGNVSKKLKEDIENLESNKRLSHYDAEIKLKNIECKTCEISNSKDTLNASLSEIQIEKDELEKEVELLQIHYEKLKSILSQNQFARTKENLTQQHLRQLMILQIEHIIIVEVKQKISLNTFMVEYLRNFNWCYSCHHYFAATRIEE